MIMLMRAFASPSQRLRFLRTLSSSSSTSTATATATATSTATSTKLKSLPVSKKHPTHIIFGANTDVGKTVVSTSLVKSNIDTNQSVHYIKPLQCGGSDEAFVLKHLNNLNGANTNIRRSHTNIKRLISSPSRDHDDNGAHTLFNWDTPASPHLASRLENKPVSDQMVISTLQDKISSIATPSPSSSPSSSSTKKIWIETAGGVLSPSSASPLNTKPRHASGSNLDQTHNLNWGWSTQADLYKPLHLPAILVGDGRLGGISATLSALESLIVRGYDIHGIVLIDAAIAASEGEGGHGSNLSALKEYANRCLSLRSGSGRTMLNHEDSIIALPPLPPPDVPLDEWFDSVQVKEQTERLDRHLGTMWNDHVDTLYDLREEGKQTLWWPFTQHQGHELNKVHTTVIDGAAGDYFSILKNVNVNVNATGENSKGSSGIGIGTDGDGDVDTKDMERTAHFDACASWWTQGLGHGETTLSLAAAAAAGKFGHIIFPDVVHEPAKALADRLLFSKSGPGRDWASRVFFTDDGSTAMEVAIKMGMKKFMYDREASGKPDLEGVKLTVCAQQDCYHGDTLGVMDVAEPSIFNEGQHPWYEPKGLFLAYPTVRYVNGSIGISPPSGCPADAITFDDIDSVLDMDERISSDLYMHYCDQIEKEWDAYEKEANRIIGSVIIEPILLGAGGMKFIDPLWQRALMSVSRSKSVPIIFDEVAAGLYRLGVSSCREIIGSNPDIAAYAKLLTGGLVPMSVTLATEDVFNTFLGDSKAEALLHGHSYTAHAVGCVSSIHALDTYAALFEKDDDGNDGNTKKIDFKKAFFDQSTVAALSELALVQESMSLGTVIAVTIEPDGGGSGYAAAGRSIPIVKYLLDHGVYARPLGNVVYIMVSPLTSAEECARLCDLLKDSILSITPAC